MPHDAFWFSFRVAFLTDRPWPIYPDLVAFYTLSIEEGRFTLKFHIAEWRSDTRGERTASSLEAVFGDGFPRAFSTDLENPANKGRYLAQVLLWLADAVERGGPSGEKAAEFIHTYWSAGTKSPYYVRFADIIFRQAELFPNDPGSPEVAKLAIKTFRVEFPDIADKLQVESVQEALRLAFADGRSDKGLGENANWKAIERALASAQEGRAWSTIKSAWHASRGANGNR